MRKPSATRIGVIVALILVGAAVQVAAQPPAVIAAVRKAIADKDFAAGERIIADYRAARGVTPEMIEALSWLGRGALAAKQWEQADAYARQTHALSLAALEGRKLDDEPHLPIALGAAIEVQAHVSAALGARSEAVAALKRELETYKDTSLLKRIQKNLNLLSLEGQAAPSLDMSEYIGPKRLPLSELKGRVVMLFFWAHWCPDCKVQGPALASLMEKYGPKGLSLVAPTQRYGYTARGKSATPDEELAYIGQVTDSSYSFLAEHAVPLSQANHERYGVSTTPTLVLVDRAGAVRLYHPGQMTLEELEPIVARLIAEAPNTAD